MAHRVVKNPSVLISESGGNAGASTGSVRDENDFSNVYRGLITAVDHVRNHITLSTGDIFVLGTGLNPKQFRCGGGGPNSSPP